MDDRLFDDVVRAIGGATTRRGALAGLAALAAALPFGAAAKNGRDDRSERSDTPEAAKKKKKCKPAKCLTGCCSGKKCLPGTSVEACGAGGAACVACAFGETCIGGACAAECSPVNCTGCCDPVTNECKAGTSTGACGVGGAACTTCTPGQVCPSGTCAAACGPANCTGCCDAATNVCNPGTAAGACGTGGAACAACSGNASCCIAGACAAGTLANQTTFGSGPGAGLAQFNFPRGVAVAGDGRTVLVTDRANYRVSMWRDSQGTPMAWSAVTTFGSGPGPLPDQFGDPLGIALAPDGLTGWVADGTNKRVAVWVRPSSDSTAWAIGTTFGTAGSGLDNLQGPTGVAVAPDRLTAWVADSLANRVSVWARPNVDSNAWTWQATFGSGPGAGPNQFDRPVGIAVSADGRTVAVAEENNDRVSVWTRPSATGIVWSNQAVFGATGSDPESMSAPVGVDLSPDGLTVWVTMLTGDRVAIWRRPDAASAAWSFVGSFGTGSGAGPSQFNGPLGIEVSDAGRTAWIVDCFNNRVSVWAETCP